MFSVGQLHAETIGSAKTLREAIVVYLRTHPDGTDGFPLQLSVGLLWDEYVKSMACDGTDLWRSLDVTSRCKLLTNLDSRVLNSILALQQLRYYDYFFVGFQLEYSPHYSPHISYGTDKENLFNNQYLFLLDDHFLYSHDHWVWFSSVILKMLLADRAYRVNSIFLSKNPKTLPHFCSNSVVVWNFTV